VKKTAGPCFSGGKDWERNRISGKPGAINKREDGKVPQERGRTRRRTPLPQAQRGAILGVTCAAQKEQEGVVIRKSKG